MPRRPDIELDLGPLNNLVKKASAKNLTVEAALKSGNFKAVGFGLFRDNEDSIWEVQSAEDGVDYIVRAEEEPENIVESDGEWSATSDKERENITLSHNHTPVYCFSSKEYGFSSKEANAFAKHILKRTKSAEFVQKLRKIAGQ